MVLRRLLPACLALSLSLTAPAVAQEMTEAERDAFREEVRAYLLEHPEVLMEAIGVLEQREREAQMAADQALASAYAVGSNNGFLTQLNGGTVFLFAGALGLLAALPRSDRLLPVAVLAVLASGGAGEVRPRRFGAWLIACLTEAISEPAALAR